MAESKHTSLTGLAESVSPQYGVPIEPILARRERLADRYDYDFGQERVFPELVDALLAEVPDGADLLEVGAATGLLTRPLLTKAGRVTALEPSAGMLRRLAAIEEADESRFTTMQGLVEDLPEGASFDLAVVTFTPRRGMGLLHLLIQLAGHVRSSVVLAIDDDGSLDWAYLARSAATQGFDVRVRLVYSKQEEGEQKRAAIVCANVTEWWQETEPEEVWEVEARIVDVPYPAPRGAATRLVRYFLAAGDRALLVRTDSRGRARLYGNLRTAVHRLGKDELAVRSSDEGVQIVRLPKAGE